MSDNITAVVEALLFAAEQPVSLEQLRSLVPGSDTAMLREAVARLKQEYETGGRGVRVDEAAGGYRMTTARNFPVSCADSTAREGAINFPVRQWKRWP
jgi:segregation and condensation protein B